MSQTIRTEKVHEKNEVICPMVLKLSKIVFFLQLYADIIKESRSVIAIYIWHLKLPIMLFEQMILLIILRISV